MKVLLVEDDTSTAELLKDFLFFSFADIEFLNCCNGNEALLVCMKERFDLIITDYKMPVMNGLDFVNILRRCYCPSQNSPVIFLSGFVPLIQDQAAVYENVHFVDKPIQSKRFVNLVSLILKQSLKVV